MNEENIYETVPEQYTNIDEKKEKALLQFLKQKPGQFFKSNFLAKTINYPTHNTCVELRLAITRLIEVYGAPIVSNAKGYAYAVNNNMLRFYAEALETRMHGLQRRINAVRKIMQKEVLL